MHKAIYSPLEIAKICDKKKSDIEAWLKEKKIPFFVFPGGHLRVAHADLKDFFIRNHMEGPKEWASAPQSPRVLLVEDDPDLLEIITELLKEDPRLEVRSENNGFTAGLQIAGWHPDLILLDFLMPGITGFDVCRQLRSNEETRDILVLALTSLSSEEDRRAIFESGASDYLSKPFHSETLLRKVKILTGLEPLPPSTGGSVSNAF